MSQQVTATVRMFRLLELGDCFLVTFTSGQATSRMLIDCGSFRNGAPSIARLEEVVTAIRDELDGVPLDVVVGTHQHNDHVSGFLHCTDAFREIGVEQVWLSWLDDPADAQARAIATDHNNLLLRLASARDALAARRDAGPRGARTLGVLNDVLEFFGARRPGSPPRVPADAVKRLQGLGRCRPLYLNPGRSVDLPGLPPETVRVHVLGPPRARGHLYRKDPRKGESYDHALMLSGVMATRFLDAIGGGDGASRNEEHYPFNEQYKRRAPSRGSPSLRALARQYRHGAHDWRTIDDDWLQQGERLALFLDSFTNNSSVVLAIELVASGKVLLFVGDAQAGNWRSWNDVTWQQAGVTTDDLLARTVFYKVGHHASHNATLVESFEKMANPDLVAVIPVHKGDPNIARNGGWKMPATRLFTRLVEKTDHRVLQMDNDNPPECDPSRPPAKQAWMRAGITPRITDLSIDLEFKG